MDNNVGMRMAWIMMILLMISNIKDSKHYDRYFAFGTEDGDCDIDYNYYQLLSIEKMLAMIVMVLTVIMKIMLVKIKAEHD